MSEWNSIEKDGYPKSGFHCLITDGENISLVQYDSKFKWSTYYSMSNFIRNKNVTHWMYLPEPPTK